MTASLPVPGRLLVVQPSADYAFRVRRHVPDALILATPERAPELAGHRVVAADVADPAAAAAAVRAAGGADGITCFVCDHLEATARIAAALGLPYHPVAAVRRSRRKDDSLSRWLDAGVPVPATAFVGGLPDLLAFVDTVPPPWILKPTDRSGSEWVLRVDRLQDLLPAHLRIRDGLTVGDRRRRTREPRYIVQKLVQGRELSADLYVEDGAVSRVLRWTEKHLVEAEGLAGLVGAYYPARLDAAERRALQATVDAAVRALGVVHGVVMVDGICHDGRLHLLEMGLRPGGDCLPDLCRLSSGYDPVRACCQAALGQDPDGGAGAPAPIAALHLMAECGGTIARLDLDAVRQHPAVLQVDPYRDVGDVLRVWAGSYDDRIVAACLVRFADPGQLPGLGRELSQGLGLQVTPGRLDAELEAA